MKHRNGPIGNVNLVVQDQLQDLCQPTENNMVQKIWEEEIPEWLKILIDYLVNSAMITLSKILRRFEEILVVDEAKICLLLEW